MTKDEALRAVAERVNWNGDDGLRDSVLGAFTSEPEVDSVDGAETGQADDQGAELAGGVTPFGMGPGEKSDAGGDGS